MKLIIDIDENLYKEVQNEVKGKVYVSGLWKSIANGIPISTDGDLNSLNEYQGEWAKGFHEGFKAGSMLAEAFNERPQGEWIPVSKCWPAFSGLYLVSIDDLVTVANFTGAYFINKRGLMLNVSAWQPLPEPYKKEGKEE